MPGFSLGEIVPSLATRIGGSINSSHTAIQNTSSFVQGDEVAAKR
jgi:hypothetical protein